MSSRVDLVVISGRSGSGKTVALHALEDLGFYCIDNLPIVFLEDLIKLAKQNYPKLAVSLDVRNMPLGDDYEELNNIYSKAIHDPDINPTIIFIDADDQVLIKRYSETRRLHPLSLKNLSLNEAIAKEAEVLKVISSIADLRIDTTNLSIHELCQQVITCVQGKPHKKIVIIFESFGYKDGIIETNMPYEIKEEDNVIKVCYFKRDDMSYTVKYLDKNTNNKLYDSEIRKNKTFEEVYTETAKESPYGYRLVGNDTQEVKIDAEDKVVIFYYEKRNDFSYTVMYLEENTNNELATPEIRENKTYLGTYSEKAKPIDGYVVDEETKEIVLEENESRIIFYYNKKDDLSYKVIYYKDSLNTDAIGEETFENQTFEDIINSDDIDKDLYKPRKGYNSGVIATDMPYTIIDGENVINVIYTKKDNLTYRVEYYYDGNIDSSKTEYFENLTYGDVITNYKEKLPADYKFVNDTAPLTIDDTEDNVIKVYYKSVSKGDVTPPKTGINNASYLSITCIIGMIALSLSKKKQEN